MTQENDNRMKNGAGAKTVILPSFRQYRDPKNAAADTMKAADLIEFLEQFDPETPVILEGYDGHLFNGLRIEYIEVSDDLDTYPHYEE